MAPSTIDKWERWESEFKKFKDIMALQCNPPEEIIRNWQRYLMVTFIQELSKNVLARDIDLPQILDKVIDAIAVGYGFKRIRFYRVIKSDIKGNELELIKLSRNHGTVKIGKILQTQYGDDAAVDSLVKRQPLIVDDAKKLKLKYRKELKIEGPYAAIPLIIENKPYGLFCADTVSDTLTSIASSRVNFLEFKDIFNMFSGAVMAAIANKYLHEQKNNLYEKKDIFLKIIKEAVAKAHSLNAVLRIIQEGCHKLIKSAERVCLSIMDPQSGQLISPAIQCIRPDKECNLCFMRKRIILIALKRKKPIERGKDIAIPILLDNTVMAVLNIEGKGKLVLDENEKSILEIITSTAAILIKTAREYEKKINEGITLIDAVRFGTQVRNFRHWFQPLMNNVMEIIGRRDRNFHLIKVEENSDEEVKLVIRETSDLNGNYDSNSIEDKLLGVEIPKNKGLSWLAYDTKKIQKITNIKVNKKLPDDRRLPYFEYDKRINSELIFPLKIKDEESNEEKVVGLLVIDSTRENDFKDSIDIDIKYCETIASFLAMVIYNHKLYKDRLKYREQLLYADRTTELSIFLNSFSHDIRKPISQLKSALNLIEMNFEDDIGEKQIIEINRYIKEGQDKSEQILTTFEQFVNNFARTVEKRQQFSLKSLIDESLATIEKSVGLEVEIEGNFRNTDQIIYCIRSFILMSFRAIIDNAIKFSHSYTGKRYIKIDINEGSSYNEAIITFENGTNQLIPDDKLELIFKPHYRLDESQIGSGMGLYLADSGIKYHRGKIIAKNIEDMNRRAVCFVVTLPVVNKLEYGVLK